MTQDPAREGIAAFVESLRDLRDMDVMSMPTRTAAAIHLEYFEHLVGLDLDPVIAMNLMVAVTEAVTAWQDETFPGATGAEAERLGFADQFLAERGVPDRLDLTGGNDAIPG